ncbi:MAG: methyltransferase domain-containing protein [Rubripirellula sp.]
MLKRDRQPELMDDPALDRDQHQLALAGLARLNAFSGVSRATYLHLRRYAKAIGNRPLRVIDVASGSGDVPISWVQKAKRDGFQIELTMIDFSQTAIDEQQRLLGEASLTARSLRMDCLQSPLPTGFDVATCSLFMHHLDDHQAFRLLQSMQASTQHAMLICDLERSRFNLELVRFASRLLSRSHVVHNDALLSVRAAYKRDEFKRLAEQALARPVRVTGSFPSRFLATFEEEVVSDAVPAFA